MKRTSLRDGQCLSRVNLFNLIAHFKTSLPNTHTHIDMQTLKKRNLREKEKCTSAIQCNKTSVQKHQKAPSQLR